MRPETGTAQIETIEAVTLGRYLVRPPAADAPRPAPVLVGFHGYGQNAERHLWELDRVDGSADWLIVSVQGLHRFYDRKAGEVVAAWMTSQDRERMILDNLAYVASIIDTIHRRHETTSTIVYCGFSQGVAMAYRAATQLPSPAAGVIALAGDVPPELQRDATIRWPRLLIGRGDSDSRYTEAQLNADLEFLKTTDADVETYVFDGGHGWVDPFREATGRFLRSVRS